MKLRKSALKYVLLICMTMFAAAGCSSFASKMQGEIQRPVSSGKEFADGIQPKNTESLLMAYQRKVHDNYNVKLAQHVYFGMEYELSDFYQDIDVSGKKGQEDTYLYDLNRCGSRAKGTLAHHSQSESGEWDKNSEVYIEIAGEYAYTYVKETDAWVGRYWYDEPGMMLLLPELLLDTEEMKCADFKKDVKKEEYILQIWLGDLLPDADDEELIELFQTPQFNTMQGIFADDIARCMREATVTYTFDSQLNLMSFRVDDMRYYDAGWKVTANMGILALYDQYGKISKTAVQVPEEELDREYYDEEYYDGYFDWDFEDWDDEIDFEDWEDEDITHDFSNVGEDLLGSINGKIITAGPNDCSLFTDAGFAFDYSEDGEYVFSVLNYDDSYVTTVYLMNRNCTECTVDELLENGFYGYEISAYGAESVPHMTWGGLTFGATLEDVIEVYGEPDDIYEDDSLVNLIYQISENVWLYFWIYDEECDWPGIRDVELYVYYDEYEEWE